MSTNHVIRRAKGAQALIEGAGLAEVPGFSIRPEDIVGSDEVMSDVSSASTELATRGVGGGREQLPEDRMIDISEILPNHMNARYDDMQLPPVDVILQGPRVDSAFDAERYNSELVAFYTKEKQRIISLCGKKSGTVTLSKMMAQHMLIGQLAFSVLKEGQCVPGEVYFSQAHGKFIVTKGHRRRLALAALNEPRQFWAIVRKATEVDAMYLHLAGVIGNEQFMPSARDTLYAMLMAMREAVEQGIEVNYHFVLSHMPTSSIGLAKLIGMLFSAAQRDETGYMWGVIQRRVFSNASQYAAVVAGCGSDISAIRDAVQDFESTKTQTAGHAERPPVRIGKRDVSRWKSGLENLLTDEWQENIRKLLAKGNDVTKDDIQTLFAQLLSE